MSNCNSLPNNETHYKWVEYQKIRNEGLGFDGYEITHERQVLFWICQFGQGYPLGNHLLFDWDAEKNIFVTNSNLSFTHCVPGVVQDLVEPFRIMATDLHKSKILEFSWYEKLLNLNSKTNTVQFIENGTWSS